MEIDSTPVPPPQEYSDYPQQQQKQEQQHQQQHSQQQQHYQQHQPNSYESSLDPIYPSESSMNFDYLNSLHDGGSNTNNASADHMDASSSSSFSNSPRHFGTVGGAGGSNQGHVDDSKVVDRSETCLV